MSSIPDNVSVIVVARHGERLDYYINNNPDYKTEETDWIATAERPFDPPLTNYGKEQARALGYHLRDELVKLGFPSISEIYTSPLLRCRQTSWYVRMGLGIKQSEPLIPVRVEYGLMESINDSWYRSWALPGSDGTWGYFVNDDPSYDVETIHPMAKQPVQELLKDWKKDHLIDRNYVSKTSIEAPYRFYPACLETSEQQRRRMKEVFSQVQKPGKTVMMVSHGGPVSHLFEELRGDDWEHHGEATYCSYSIYKRIATEKGTDTIEAVQINQSDHIDNALVPSKIV
jgi:broad specificity phosphatase PhoE